MRVNYKVSKVFDGKKFYLFYDNSIDTAEKFENRTWIKREFKRRLAYAQERGWQYRVKKTILGQHGLIKIWVKPK